MVPCRIVPSLTFRRAVARRRRMTIRIPITLPMMQMAITVKMAIFTENINKKIIVKFWHQKLGHTICTRTVHQCNVSFLMASLTPCKTSCTTGCMCVYQRTPPGVNSVMLDTESLYFLHVLGIVQKTLLGG